MTAKTSRPLSPHLTIWKWGPHMLVSILHRVTGGALTVAGLALLTAWLLATAGDPASYAAFTANLSLPFFELLGLPPAGGKYQFLFEILSFKTVLVFLTWAFFQHLFSGLRHFVMDMGAGYELKINKLFAVLTIAAALFATAVTWFALLEVGR